MTHIVFDVDGTLLDTAQANLRSLGDTLRQLTGREYAPQELAFALSLTSQAALVRLGLPDIPGALALWMEKLALYAPGVRVFPGVAEVLPALKARGCTLGILTSKTRAEYASEFLPHGLGHWFATVICADDAEYTKPHPAPMLAYLARSGARPEQVLYIGDSPGDMACAGAAGVRFLHAAWSGEPTPPGAGQLHRPEELLRLL